MKNFFSKITFLTLFILLSHNLCATNNSLFNPKTEEEALFLRRIADFWKDGEVEITKHQIQTFINDNPNNSLVDSLFAILGDIYVNEKNYSKAVAAFDNIKSEDIKDKIAINLLSSLYHLKWHSRLIDECENYLTKVDDELKEKITYLQGLTFYNKSLEENNEKDKINLSLRAKNKFESLLESRFQNQSQEYLSQIYKNLNDFEAASNYYLNLAKKDTSKKEEYLFQAALLQYHFNKEQAIATFDLIIQDPNSLKTADAAYNKLLILFEMKKYEDIISNKDMFLQIISTEKTHIANFFIGKCYFKINNFENACPYLEKSLEIEDNNLEQMKSALIMLMQSSFHLNNLNLFSKTYKKFILEFPNDEQITECLFAKALLNKNNEKYEDAKIDFEKITEISAPSEKNEKYLFEFAHLLYLMEDIGNSKIKFNEFIETYPNHELVKNALIHTINCTIKNIQKEKSEEHLTSLRKEFIEEIKSLLSNDSFSMEEKGQYKYLLAKTYFDLENYNICLEMLQNLIKDNFKQTNENKESFLSKNELSEIHLLIGFCHKNINENLDEFIHYAKLALELADDPKNQFSTLINLFNSYLILAKNNSASEENLSKAADYLYKAYELFPKDLNKNNLSWLGDYYANIVKSYLNKNYNNTIDNNFEMTLICQKAVKLLEDLLNEKDENFENISIQLAYLYKYQGFSNKELEVLEKLIQNYRFFPEKSFKCAEEAIFMLAKNYEAQNNIDKAISLYNEFMPICNKDNLFKYSSNLHLVRLQLAQIPKEDFTIKNKDLEKIVSSLKTISLQKMLENEPVHLEAALDYVDTVCYMEEEQKWEKRLFLLNRLQESFNEKENVLSEDYHKAKNILKDKEKLFNSYMYAIDAEKNICSGYLEKDNNQIQKAKDLLVNMINEKSIYTEYLQNRINNNMKLIEDFVIEKK